MIIAKRCLNENEVESGVKKSELAIAPKRPLERGYFQVQELLGERREDLIKVVTVWNQVAEQKMSMVSSVKKKKTLANSEFVTRKMAEGLSRGNSRFFACQDRLGGVQALAQVDVSVEGLYLDYLASNPRNILPAKGEARVRGAGTALMRHLFRVCAKEGRLELSLFSLEEASSFYKKNKLKFSEPGVKGGIMRIDHKTIQRILRGEEKKIRKDKLEKEDASLRLGMQKYLAAGGAKGGV